VLFTKENITMATATDGENAGRTGRPERQAPGRKFNGSALTGVDPTNERGQTPSEIFGFPIPYSTGARGSAGSNTGTGTDVTLYDGQLEESVTGLSGSAITSTGAPGSQGAANGDRGETITYTDPFGVQGGINREVTVRGHVSGEGDWTQANDMGYSGGPTLPILQNARPTSTGAGHGRVRGAGAGL
jgi:hypothetical protein